ncbi:protein OSCP1 [Elysia marginata]|uniref:Protein OSCP1 n=1 Tax=Elysia marginata TaxID=1093978 RepID=A0AAV4J547_9GAST|nr:protein OSCP1 [Elysia marginata]
MSLKTLPLLFINLGGEMMYILDQRLRAQNIPTEKSKKVLNDIVATMFNKRFMEELFKPQTLYSKKAMRTVFDRLAHASIMRLNAASMDKLYDLMTMAFKYQVSLALRPKDILLITLNHMDTMRSYVEDSSGVRSQVEHVYRMLSETYASLSQGEFQLIRQTLLNFFQDMHIRVSIFLKDKVQNNNGRFVLKPGGSLPYGTEAPGLIRSFDASGKSRNIAFAPGANYTVASREGSFDLRGDRITKLGCNMYSASRPVETSGPSISKSVMQGSDMDTSNPDPLAKAHLDLLSRLIGANVTNNEFRLNLFKNDQEEDEAASIQPIEVAESQVVNIDASKGGKTSELTRIMGEMSVGDKGGGGDDSDLLDLMDS